jgi:hypothetical protein
MKMAYQDIYVEMDSDILKKPKGSGSQHGMNKRISLDINSVWCHVGYVRVTTSGKQFKMDESAAWERIRHFSDLGNAKKVKEWELKLQERGLFNEEASKKEWVRVNIDIGDHPKVEAVINGVNINHSSLYMVNLVQNQKYKELIKWLKETKGIDVVAEAVALEV